MKKKNILITAPSLDTKHNVSGISAMVRIIIEHNHVPVYHHFLFGRKDNDWGDIVSILLTIRQLLIFPFILKKYKINLVHQNFPFDPKGVLRESVAGLWCKLLGIPVLLHVHGGKFLTGKKPYGIYRFLAKKLFHKSHVVLVLSELERDIMQKEYQRTDVCVLENCVDSSQFIQADKLMPAEIPVFIFLGRIHESKGLHEILDVFKRLNGEHVPFRFVLCGDGSLRASIVPKFESLLGKQFDYKGVVSGMEKINAIRSADFFLLPSWFEGLPVTMLETMAAGVVPVITDVGSIGQLVHHQENGIIIEKQNVTDMHQKIKDILAHPERYAALSKNAKESVLRDYDVSQYVHRLNEIYGQVLSAQAKAKCE
ncbi:MAG: glycosyltransferase family 4 protein [Tannerella sp.]|jgi:glycosyltransferase involved in cell wall biosynthesis|nr:glycosyltransferase family 4 protein [Tannerella sp.]